jgi:PKD repeat protein
MKKLLLAIGICIFMICSSVVINVAAQPIIRLPSESVTMTAVYTSESWFILTLSNIPAGFDITDGPYMGWCVEISKTMSLNVDHTVKLYSTYESAIPLISENWDKVNYVINHYEDPLTNRHSIQDVIWKLICDDPLQENNTYTMELYNDTNANGEGFIPSAGEKIAVLADVVVQSKDVQLTILEVPLRGEVSLGDLVWNDSNNDGIQDKGEPGLQGVTVHLMNESGSTIETKTTDSYGYYSFSGYPEGNYSLQFVLKSSNYRFSPVNQASDDSMDSDADPTTGMTPVFTAFISGTNDMSWDAGMYLVEEPGSPGDQGTPVPPPAPENRAPTADGSAGEPYVALFGQEILFNGSKSYDSDGTIVTYHWTFGDGTTEDGMKVTHNYTSPGNYSVTLTVTDNKGATDTYTTRGKSRLPNQPPLAPTLTGSETGSTDETYVLRLVTTDPNNDNVRYMVSWGDGMQNTSAVLNSGQNTQMLHRWNTWGFYTIQSHAEDDYENAASNISSIVVAVDVQYVGDLGYLIDTDSNGLYDAFYSNSTGTQTTVQRQQTGTYLIDTNGDGQFDYLYDPSTGTSREYPEALSPSYTMLLIGVGVAVIVLLLIGFLMRRRWKKP